MHCLNLKHLTCFYVKHWFSQFLSSRFLQSNEITTFRFSFHSYLQCCRQKQKARSSASILLIPVRPILPRMLFQDHLPFFLFNTPNNIWQLSFGTKGYFLIGPSNVLSITSDLVISGHLTSNRIISAKLLTHRKCILLREKY